MFNNIVVDTHLHNTLNLPQQRRAQHDKNICDKINYKCASHKGSTYLKFIIRVSFIDFFTHKLIM